MHWQKQMFLLVHNGETFLWRNRNVSKESCLSWVVREELHFLVLAVNLDLFCMFKAAENHFLITVGNK